MNAETLLADDVQGSNLLPVFCKAVADDLDLLTSLHGSELSAALYRILRTQKFPLSLALLFKSPEARSVVTMLYEEICGWPHDFPRQVADELAADYAAIYLNNYCNASPQESYWLDEDHLAWQEPMFQVRACYAEHGLAVENWRIQADDHLVPELQFVSHLLGLRNSDDHLAEAAKFLDEHLLLWLGDFSRRVARRCETPFYAGLALLTNHYCESLRDILALMLEQPRPEREQILQKIKREKAEPVPVKFMPGAEVSW